jgi:hypothetical protein
MLTLTHEDNRLVIQADRYQLVFHTDRPFISLQTQRGTPLADLFTLSSVHPLHDRDDTYQVGKWASRETPDGLELTLLTRSTAWQSKTFRVFCTPERFTYGIEIEGDGLLAEVNYLGGYSSESLRWGTGFFWSGQQFQQVFNPEPNIPEVLHYPAGGTTTIDLTGIPLPRRADWFFTPPPFCFAAQYEEGWLALGVEAAPGRNTFTEYTYHGSLEAFHLSLAYEGHTRVSGRYTLPTIGFDFAEDEYAAVAAHIRALRAAGHAPTPTQRVTPDWWRAPIFCGWGAQCYLAEVEKGRAPDYARQALYEDFLAALTAHDVQPGIVVLDDKWQAAYGTNEPDTSKWPDLRGFIARQHEQGRRVLLWLRAWSPEGVPVEECITHAGGLPVGVDPTNPAYERRLRAAIHHLLSPDGLDADGFKVDYTARIPSGPGLRLHGEAWGLELMRRFLEILYSAAKTAKPDALVMTHTVHPYLADVLDMIRLNDINPGRNVNRAMRHRARIAALACPDAIIDTDNWPITDRATWRAYLAIQPEMGVSSLYFATHIDTTLEPLTEEDYALIRQTWARQRARQQAHRSPTP